MKIIYNRFIPFPGFYAINLFGIIFARRGEGQLSSTDVNHERIHTRQQLELLFVFFYLIYLIEWLFWLVCLRNSRRAYHRISFEREAYLHQADYDYLSHRPLYAWARRH